MKFTIIDAMKAAGYEGLPGGAECIRAAEARESKDRVIDTLDILICRDDVDDIPVQVDILRVHRGRSPYHEDGSRFPYEDDPSEVEFGDAFVTADVPPFINGQSIELTHEELEQAEEEYFNQ